MRYIPYGRQSIDKRDIQAIIKVLKSDWLTQGPKVKEFEEKLAKYCRAKYAVAVSSGTAALHIACLAAGIRQRDEVITSPITFVASANCVLYCGGKPVFADIQEDTVNIDPEEIKKKINKRTKAIIPVHFAGHPCDLVKIHRIAKKYNLIVIEDACHALGAAYKFNNKWLKVGSCQHSDMAVFSFHPVKSITTGEGGAITTNDRRFYEKLIMLRNHGITRDITSFKYRSSDIVGPWYYEMQGLGFNYRITDIQCALGISQLKKIDVFIKRRREIAGIYNKALKDLHQIILPSVRDSFRPSHHLYVIRINSERTPLVRKDIFSRLRKLGIGVNVHYIPVHLQPYYQMTFGYKWKDMPISEDYYRSCITLPLYLTMKDTQVKRVINRVRSVFK